MKYLELCWFIYRFSPEKVADLNKIKNASEEQGRAFVEAYGYYTHTAEALYDLIEHGGGQSGHYAIHLVKEFLQLIPNNSKRFHDNLENSNFYARIPGLGNFLASTIRGKPKAYQPAAFHSTISLTLNTAKLAINFVSCSDCPDKTIGVWTKRIGSSEKAIENSLMVKNSSGGWE